MVSLQERYFWTGGLVCDTRATDNTSCYNLDNRYILREITVKIRLERIDTQEEITVETLLDSGATELVISLEFARK